MDPVWANTWRRFFGLKARTGPSRRRRTHGDVLFPVHTSLTQTSRTLGMAAWTWSSPPDVDEHTARMLAEVNGREGNFIDYD